MFKTYIKKLIIKPISHIGSFHVGSHCEQDIDKRVLPNSDCFNWKMFPDIKTLASVIPVTSVHQQNASSASITHK